METVNKMFINKSDSNVPGNGFELSGEQGP